MLIYLTKIHFIKIGLYLKKNIITRPEYYTFIVLMIASRFKIENDERLTMDDYFEVLDSFMRLEIKRK